jgi:undecaprenyl-diphosphatase
VFVVVALFLAVLWRKPWLFVAVLCADAAVDLFSYGMRDWIGRRRPPLVYPEPKPLVHVPHSGSFPSGHAATAFACATVLAWWDRRLAVPAFVVAAVIAWSRVYVGVHWPLDVLGGAVLGLGIGYALVLLGRRWRFGAGGDSAS